MDKTTEKLLAMGQTTLGVVVEVGDRDDAWEIGYESEGSAKFGMFLSKEYEVEPQIGQKIRVYTQLGSTIRGVDLDDKEVFFKTREEMDEQQKLDAEARRERMKAEYEEHRAEYERQFDSLPETFQRRVQWFRDHNPDFYWEWEPYELSACIDAVVIAEWAADREAEDPTKLAHDHINDFADLPSEEQVVTIPGVAYDLHSGNSFSCAVMLATHFVIDPEWPFYDHGAATPLVGCDDYGCHHPRPGVEDFIARHRAKLEVTK